MRVDERGDPCPATLGEYRDLCAAIGGPDCRAVKLLDLHIARGGAGRDEIVVASDEQMRRVLMPLLLPEDVVVDKIAPPTTDKLTMWTIYNSPKDRPGEFIARRLEILSGEKEPFRTRDIMVADKVEPIRERLSAAGFTRMERDPADDPVIMETWL